MPSLFAVSFIRHWAVRGEPYDTIAERLDRIHPYDNLTPADVLMILLELSNGGSEQWTKRQPR